MKWKSLKRGLAIVLSALMITSSASVYAEEPQSPQTQTEADGSVESPQDSESGADGESKPEESAPDEGSEPEEGSETPAESEPGEAKPGEDSETPTESKPATETEPTETPGTETPGMTETEPTETPETKPTETPETKPTETETTGKTETETTETTETETTGKTETEASEPTETETTGKTETETPGTTETKTIGETETESTQVTETETIVEETTETENETETETETETKTQEIVVFADIQDVVTFNTGNLAISVIPSDDYSDELFEACLDDNIYVMPFDEDGSFTIEAEVDAFFPYEVQFQYDGKIENRWFLSPYDRTTVGGHTFCIHSEFSGDVITQMSLKVAGKPVVVYPQKKVFTNNGGISAYSLMPLEEKQLTVDLKGFNPLQLTRVSVSGIFAGENEISADKVAWCTSGDDGYKINSMGDYLDLSFKTSYGGATWEMIVGNADQLTLSNIRYRVFIDTDRTENWLKPVIYQQNSDGSYTDDLTKSFEYYDGIVYRHDAQWDDWMERTERIGLVVSDVRSDGLFIKFDLSDFGNADVKVYEGQLKSSNEAGSENEITAEIFNGMGYNLPGTYEYITFMSFDRDGNVTGFLPVRIDVREASEYFGFHAHMADGESCSAYAHAVSGDASDSCLSLKCELYNGYSADQQYYLQAWHYINGMGNSGTTGANGVTVFKGIYNSIEEAQDSGAADITSAIFGDGYPDNYKEGVDFSFFVDGKVFQYNVSVVESDRQPTLNNSADFQITGLKDASGNDIRAYGMQTDEDSYAEYNYLTILVDGNVDLSNIALVYSASDSAKVYCQDSSSPEESGKTLHDFSNGMLQYTVVSGSGENAVNYWIQVVKADLSNAKLYINSLTDPDAKTEVREGVIYTTRKVMIDGMHNYMHDIVLANMGNADISNISVVLDSDVLELDPYWTLNGNQNLGTFNSEEINDNKISGELSNLAKIRLKRKEGVLDGTDVTGTLKVQEAGRDILVMNLTGTIGDPYITTTELPVAVKYVPYETLFQHDNQYDQNNVTYSLAYGSELPEGMELKPTGELYGVPKGTGTFHIVVRMDNTIDDFGSYVREYDLIVLDNTDENVNNATQSGYELSTKLSPIPSSSDYIIVSEGPYSEFRNVYIDGDQLEKGVDYNAESGSTRITIRSETLSKRGSGTHTLGIEFRQGGEDTGKLIRVAQNYNAEDIGVVQKPSTDQDKDNVENNGDVQKPSTDNNKDNTVPDGNTENSVQNNVVTSLKPDKSNNLAVEAVPIREVFREGYITLQIDVSKDGILKADILNKYAGQKVYLNVIFSRNYGMTIDMYHIPFVSNDIKILYPLSADPGMTPEFYTFHAIPDAIKPLEFEAIFNFHVGEEHAGKKAYIYVLNEAGTGYDLACTAIVNEIGNIAFTSANVTDVIIFVER